MPRVLLVGMLQGPVAWLAIAAVIAVALQWSVGTSPTATIGVSLLAGAFAWAALGLMGNAVARWRERRAILAGSSGERPRDGRSAVVIGTLEPLGAVLEAPLDGSRCLIYRYDVTFDKGAGRRRVIGTVARGVGVAPCTIATPAGSYRLLAVPDIDADTPETTRERQLTRFEAYAARTTFTPGAESADELLRQWADSDGEYRADVRFDTTRIEPSLWILRQQHVPVGARVCVFGRYSAERRGLVAPGAAPMRLITGDPAAVARTLGSQMRFRAVLSLALGAASAALLASFVSG